MSDYKIFTELIHLRDTRERGVLLNPPNTPENLDDLPSQKPLREFIHPFPDQPPLLNIYQDAMVLKLDARTIQKPWEHGYLISDTEVLLTDSLHMQARQTTRMPSDDYWPSIDEAIELIPEWASLLRNELQALFNDEEWEDPCGPFASLAEAWRWAKRRYGIKRNSCTRLAYLTGVDPEGRARFFVEPFPEHIIAALYQADMEVGAALWGERLYEKDLGGTIG